MENLPEPLEDGDAVNKKYVDGVVEDLTLKQGLIRENGGFNLVDSYINMNFNNIRNVGYPKHTEDAVPRSFVDDMVKEVEEKINKRKHLIAVHARYCGVLKQGEYQFKFSGANFENCEEILGVYEDFKGSITGFVMPHSGHLKKIICEGLIFKSLDNITDFIFNFITDHKKELKLSDIALLEKAAYLDIEDVLKKGKVELKKTLEKEDLFKENEISLDTVKNMKTEFQIVKFEKSFNSKDYLTVEKLPKIISSVLLERMDFKGIDFNKKMVGIGSISRFTKNDYFSLSEGDVINIKTIYEDEKMSILIRDKNITRLIANFIAKSLNFNFTFLIELDPL